MQTVRLRIIAASTGLLSGLAVGLLLAVIVGRDNTGAFLAIGVSLGALLGLWLGPSLAGADNVKTVAVGLLAGTLSVPLYGIGWGIATGLPQLVRGDPTAVFAPLVLAVYVLYAFSNALVVAVPSALVWAVITRRLANRGAEVPPNEA